MTKGDRTPFLLTTEPGLEDLVAEELLERMPDARVQAEPYGSRGQVRAEVADAAPLYDLATIDHVVEIRDEGEAATLDDIRRVVGEVEVPELSDVESFRVTSTCPDGPDFTRREIQGAAGAVLQRRHGTRADLTEFDMNVRVDLYGSRLMVGVQRTRRSLARRIRRSKSLRTSLKPTIAAAMVRLAGAQRGPGRLIDPLCGTGSIPIEAKRMNPHLDVYACDWDGPTVEVARATVENHDLAIDVRSADARSLRGEYPKPFDYIVTDPPYGVRLGKRAGIGSLYSTLMPSLAEALADDGRIVLAVVKFRTLLATLEGSGLRVLTERIVGAGNVRPRLVVLAHE